MTPTARPRFRTDLVAEPIEDGGHRYIDVVDPDTGNGFRFYDVEYSLACAMDGERDVEGLVVWAKEELGIEPSTRELATVITTLGDLGYLSGADAGEPELAPGVYAAPRDAGALPIEDVELGHGGAGGYAPEDVPLPRGDFELGMSGGGPSMRGPSDAVSGPELGAAGGQREVVMEFEAPTPPPAEMPYASMRPTTRPDAEDDGPTNLPSPSTANDFDDDEVSVDLSDHLAISASDVKEAVRASKVMKAVDLPADLQAQLESSDRELAAAREAAERAAAERAETQRAAEERAAAERMAAERMAAEAARPAVELPRPPVGVSRPASRSSATTSERPVEKSPPLSVAKEPGAAPSGGGAFRLVLLVVLLIAAGLLYYWYGYLKKPLPWKKAGDTAEVGQGPGPATGAGPSTGGPVTPPTPPTPPPPPPPPSATLAESAAPPSDVPAGQVGIVELIAAEGSTVATGDPLVRFKGNPAWTSKLVGLDYDIDTRVPKQIADATKARDAAQASGNAAQVKRHQTTIDERTKRLADKVNERQQIRDGQDALTVKSPATGVVAMKIAKGARTKADQVVATVTPASVLSASFNLSSGISAGGKTPAVDASVRVAVKAAPETKANCTVSAAEGVQVTVVCPADTGLAAGTEIILE